MKISEAGRFLHAFRAADDDSRAGERRRLDAFGRRQVDAERRRRERGLELLAEAGVLLAASLDLEVTVSSIASLGIRDLADVCLVELADEDGRGARVTAAARKAEDAVTAAHLDRSMVDRRSILEVPLRVRGKQLGVLVLIRSEGIRRFDRADVLLAEELAGRAALAIDNARTYAEARRAVAARDELLAVVAHDLRNPVGTILMQAGFLEASETAAEGDLPPARRIARAASRMKRLIEDLLDASRIDAGRLCLRPCSVSVSALVSEAVSAERPRAASLAIDLAADIEAGLPDVRCDPDRILQVLENLIGNAFKHTRPGGMVTVGVSCAEREVGIWVEDTGAGIAEADLPHVFDRFWQARCTGRKGAGLGLAIAKGIVEAHGGRIWAASVPERGTRLAFTLPMGMGELR